MVLEITIPTVGESITEVTIGAWLKQDGDWVEKDEIICSLESDKAELELPAENEGTLKILVAEGEDVPVGSVIGTLEPTANAQAPESPPEESISVSNSATDTAGELVDVVIPTVGESITEVGIAAWLKQDGDFVNENEIICELESDKSGFELPAEVAGTLKILTDAVENIPVGTTIAQIIKGSGQVAPSERPTAEAKDSTYATGHASPAAAKILAEKNIVPQTVKGTGVDGRITKTDALDAKKAPKPSPAKKAPAPASPPPVSSPKPDTRSTTQERMSSLRKTIAKRLVSAKNETAMLTTFNEVDMKAIMDIRKSYKESFKDKYETGLGFMSFFTRAVCIALQEWPAVNGQIQDNQIIYHHYCDISIAVSSPKGLVVPVIRNAETLSFDGIEKEVIRLAKKARAGKLSIEEMTGGTFTITNGGIFGSMLSTPILNQPQSAILGMHNIVQRPVAIDGQVLIRPVMYLALSYDHRIVDGRESVSFLYRVKELLEDPIRLLLKI